MQLKVLITGANGFLGQYLVRLLLEQQYVVIATGKGENRLPFEENDRFIYASMDVSNPGSVQTVFDRYQPNIVVHAAAVTQVDDAETNPEKCEQVNVQGTAEVLVDTENYAQYFIFLSTDFVFDGNKGMYSEEDELQPLSFYGFSKMQGEAIVQTSSVPYAIVRTCLVYGSPLSGTRSNILQWVAGKLKNNEPVKVVNDQVRTPTYVEDLAIAITQMIRQRCTGIYHISGRDVLTPYDMAIATARYLGYDTGLITAVNAETFKEKGKRPLKTGFNISKAQQDFNYQPRSFEEGLKKTFQSGEN